MLQERAGNAPEQSLAQGTVAARSYEQEAHVVLGGGIHDGRGHTALEHGARRLEPGRKLL
jgi:hypothetical protein